MNDNNYLKISCRHCKGHIEFPKEACGQETPCPHCGEIILLRKSFPKIAVFASLIASVLVISAILLPKLLREKADTSTLTFAQLESFTTDELRTKAEKGNMQAQAKLGLVYGNGRGVPVDYDEAVKWYRKAAEQGDANAQNNLGLMYQNGWGVPIDYAEAIKWFRKAAEQGLLKAQFNLAVIYSNAAFHYPEGLSKNLPANWSVKDMEDEALKWFRKAAEQGFVEAQTTLAYASDFGFGVPEDAAEKLKWYRKAAEHGCADGQSGLAGMYALGQGVPKDYIEAYKWESLAVAQGIQGSPLWRKGSAVVIDENTQNFPADQITEMKKYHADKMQAEIDMLAALSSIMTAEEIQEAGRRVRAFSVSH